MGTSAEKNTWGVGSLGSLVCEQICMNGAERRAALSPGALLKGGQNKEVINMLNLDNITHNDHDGLKLLSKKS